MTQNLFKTYANFRNLTLFFIFLMAVGLPLSKYLTSASQILLVVTWLAEGNFDEKWRRIRMRPQILIFAGIFIIPLLGMLYTQDVKFGIHDLKLKLPLLLMPLVLGSIRQLNDREMRLILGGFVAAVFAGAVVSLSIMLGIGPSAYTGDRESILFISHIRFSLMLVLAVFILVHFAFHPRTPSKFRLILTLGALSLILFIFMLKSLTGVVILITGGMLLSLRWVLKQQEMMLKWFVIVGLATIPVITGFYLTDQISRFHTIRDDAGQLDRVTAKGNPYWHDTSNPMIENGFHVGYYLCETELRGAWNGVSHLDYDGFDKKGQQLKYTLFRYMTSKGLRKDSYGLTQMEPEDIVLVESGMANCIYRQPKRFSVRIYQTLWEFDEYRKGANPSGHSVIQRFEYLKTGWAIFKDHPVFGVGTGDTKMAFDQKYEQLQSRLDPDWRKRAHNQFLTFLLTFGLVGFSLIMCTILLPVFLEKRKDNFFILMFLLVAMLSMLNEDTLETQAGVAFFAIFYSLFVFAQPTAPTPITDNRQPITDNSHAAPR